MDSSRGSLWHIWDLHVHAPGTKLNDGYRGATDENWKKFIAVLEGSAVRAVGITDYYSIDGFRYLLDKKKQGALKDVELFPNVEFRLPQSANKAGEEINVHVLFDNSEAVIEKIKQFLSALETINTKTDQTRYFCSPSDLKVLGYDKACVEMAAICETLEKTFGSERPYLIVGVANGYGGIRPDTASPRKVGIAEEIDKRCDMFFARSQDKEFFLKEDRYEESQKKPVISGSDSHSFKELEDWLGKRYADESGLDREITWIKADLTFEGLRQTIHEPESRVYVGNNPIKLDLIDVTPQYFIDRVVIKTKKDDSEWFDHTREVLFNPELIAVIGNKGSGKSALADLVAMSSNSESDSFSFLNIEKFLALQAHKKYSVEAIFLDKESSTKFCSSPDYDRTTNSRVVYLSQDFVKRMCESANIEDLQREIDRVIFDRMPGEERRGASSLEEVVKDLCDSIDQQIQQERLALNTLNKKIFQHESYLSPTFRVEIQRKLLAKEREYEHLDNDLPPVVVPMIS